MESTKTTQRSWALLAVLVLGYIGIYICRKNFSVAVPLIRKEFGLTKEDIGNIASWSTAAYTIGKFVFGPLIDRVGGRISFLAALVFVAIFGALGGWVNSLMPLLVVYSLNRLAGSAGWGGMVKQVPGWFSTQHLPLAMGVLSLSFVFGGLCATMLAGWVAEWSGNNWRWVMSAPSAILAVIVVICWVILPREPAVAAPSGGKGSGKAGFQFKQLAELLSIRRFWIVCSLSFTLTLVRETFNTWTVDFFKTTGGAEVSTKIAALLSTPFDALGAVGIMLLGWYFGRIQARQRGWLLFWILAVLAGLVYALPILGAHSLMWGTVAVGGVGFLVYGPYSLLAGIMSVEIRGPAYVGSVAGFVDGVGYLASILAGKEFGRILDIGGYRLGFTCLAGLSAASALLCLFLYTKTESPSGETGPTAAA